jgi:TetR/AcrR family transcriptional repressor of mexJK operon
MPRALGQIDVAKNEAILDAALEVLEERGDGAAMSEIARRAHVSKQTIYNHYGSKADLVRALAQRRVHEITAPLEGPEAQGNPMEALTAFARVMVQGQITPRGLTMLRMAIRTATTMPEIGETLFEAGVMASRRRLADFLQVEAAAGRLSIPDPLQAAEFFMGMLGGSRQFASLLGVPPRLTEAAVDAIAQETVSRFVRAYAVEAEVSPPPRPR